MPPRWKAESSDKTSSALLARRGGPRDLDQRTHSSRHREAASHGVPLLNCRRPPLAQPIENPHEPHRSEDRRGGAAPPRAELASSRPAEGVGIGSRLPAVSVGAGEDSTLHQVVEIVADGGDYVVGLAGRLDPDGIEGRDGSVYVARGAGAVFSAECNNRNVIEQVNTAARHFRDGGGLVVPLWIAFAPDYSDLNPSLPLLAMVAQAGCLKDRSEGPEFVPELVISEADVVVTHKRPGPFTDSVLAEVLKEHGIENVIVCGVATNASVEGAVRQSADLGYRTTVLSDATSAADAASHEASLASMGLFGTVQSVKEFMSRLA